MNPSSPVKPSNQISHKHCSIKIISTQKVSGRLSVTVRLVKTPPASSLSKPSQGTKVNLINDILPATPAKTFGANFKNLDPSDFIEPVPCTQEFMQTGGSVDNELCDTLPILPRAYSIRPSVALRNSIKRRGMNKKTVYSPSPRHTMKAFVKFWPK